MTDATEAETAETCMTDLTPAGSQGGAIYLYRYLTEPRGYHLVIEDVNGRTVLVGLAPTEMLEFAQQLLKAAS